MNDFLGLLNHLKFGNPKGSLSDGNGKVVDFDSEELPDRNFYRVDEIAELNLTAEKFLEDFVFKSAQRQITFRQKITGAASRVEDFQRREFILKCEKIFLAVASRLFEVRYAVRLKKAG